MPDLRARVIELREFLASVGETSWNGRLNDILSGTTLTDGHRLIISSWFGGMGSLNDLMISPVNGHKVPPGAEAAANERLAELRLRLHEAVRADCD